jgi:hypothetical protein
MVKPLLRPCPSLVESPKRKEKSVPALGRPAYRCILPRIQRHWRTGTKRGGIGIVGYGCGFVIAIWHFLHSSLVGLCRARASAQRPRPALCICASVLRTRIRGIVDPGSGQPAERVPVSASHLACPATCDLSHGVHGCRTECRCLCTTIQPCYTGQDRQLRLGEGEGVDIGIGIGIGIGRGGASADATQSKGSCSFREGQLRLGQGRWKQGLRETAR